MDSHEEVRHFCGSRRDQEERGGAGPSREPRRDQEQGVEGFSSRGVAPFPKESLSPESLTLNSRKINIFAANSTLLSAQPESDSVIIYRSA